MGMAGGSGQRTGWLVVIAVAASAMLLFCGKEYGRVMSETGSGTSDGPSELLSVGAPAAPPSTTGAGRCATASGCSGDLDEDARGHERWERISRRGRFGSKLVGGNYFGKRVELPGVMSMLTEVALSKWGESAPAAATTFLGSRKRSRSTSSAESAAARRAKGDQHIAQRKENEKASRSARAKGSGGYAEGTTGTSKQDVDALKKKLADQERKKKDLLKQKADKEIALRMAKAKADAAKKKQADAAAKIKELEAAKAKKAEVEKMNQKIKEDLEKRFAAAKESAEKQPSEEATNLMESISTEITEKVKEQTAVIEAKENIMTKINEELQIKAQEAEAIAEAEEEEEQAEDDVELISVEVSKVELELQGLEAEFKDFIEQESRVVTAAGLGNAYGYAGGGDVSALPVLPGVGLIGSGFDPELRKGCTFDHCRTRDVLQYTYAKGQVANTHMRPYKVPDQLFFRSINEASATTNVYKNSEEKEKAEAMSAGAAASAGGSYGGPGFSVSGSVSASGQTSEGSTSSSKESDHIAERKIDIDLYSLSLDLGGGQVHLDPNFKREILALPPHFSKAPGQWIDFVRRWGRFVVRAGHFGGTMMFDMRFQSTASTSTSQMADAAELAADMEFSSVAVGGSASVNAQYSSSDESAAASLMSNSKVSITANGGDPEITSTITDLVPGTADSALFRNDFQNWVNSIADFPRLADPIPRLAFLYDVLPVGPISPYDLALADDNSPTEMLAEKGLLASAIENVRRAETDSGDGEAWLKLGGQGHGDEPSNAKATDWSEVKYALQQAINAFGADPGRAMRAQTIECGCMHEGCMSRALPPRFKFTDFNRIGEDKCLTFAARNSGEFSVALSSGVSSPWIFRVTKNLVTLSQHGMRLAESDSTYGNAFTDPSLSAHFFICVSEKDGQVGLEYGRGNYRVMKYVRPEAQSNEPPPSYFAFSCSKTAKFSDIQVLSRPAFASSIRPAPCTVENCHKVKISNNEDGQCDCAECRYGYQLQSGDTVCVQSRWVLEQCSSPATPVNTAVPEFIEAMGKTVLSFFFKDIAGSRKPFVPILSSRTPTGRALDIYLLGAGSLPERCDYEGGFMTNVAYSPGREGRPSLSKSLVHAMQAFYNHNFRSENRYLVDLKKSEEDDQNSLNDHNAVQKVEAGEEDPRLEDLSEQDDKSDTATTQKKLDAASIMDFAGKVASKAKDVDWDKVGKAAGGIGGLLGGMAGGGGGGGGGLGGLLPGRAAQQGAVDPIELEPMPDPTCNVQGIENCCPADRNLVLQWLKTPGVACLAMYGFALESIRFRRCGRGRNKGIMLQYTCTFVGNMTQAADSKAVSEPMDPYTDRSLSQWGKVAAPTPDTVFVGLGLLEDDPDKNVNLMAEYWTVEGGLERAVRRRHSFYGMTRHGRRRSARRALHYLFKAKIAMAKKSGFSADFLKRQLKRMSKRISRRKTPWVDQTIASGYQLTRLRKIGCRKGEVMTGLRFMKNNYAVAYCKNIFKYKACMTMYTNGDEKPISTELDGVVDEVGDPFWSLITVEQMQNRSNFKVVVQNGPAYLETMEPDVYNKYWLDEDRLQQNKEYLIAILGGPIGDHIKDQILKLDPEDWENIKAKAKKALKMTANLSTFIAKLTGHISTLVGSSGTVGWPGLAWFLTQEAAAHVFKAADFVHKKFLKAKRAYADQQMEAAERAREEEVAAQAADIADQVASMNKGIPVSLSLPRIVNGREEQLYMGSNDRLGHGAMRSLKSADGPPVPLTMDVVDSPRVKSEIKDATTQQLVLDTIKGAVENIDLDKIKGAVENIDMDKVKGFMDKVKENELVGKSVDLIKKMIPGAKAKFEEMGGVEGLTNMITDIKDGNFNSLIEQMETGHFSDVIKSFPGGVGGEKWQELKFKLLNKLEEIREKFDGSRLQHMVGVAQDWFFKSPDADEPTPLHASDYFIFENVVEPSNEIKTGYAMPPTDWAMPSLRGGGGIIYDLAYVVTNKPSKELEVLYEKLSYLGNTCQNSKGEEVDAA